MARRTIKDARAIVTGASSGIGREIALELSRQGARLVVLARREEKLQRLAEEIRGRGGEAAIVAGDVTDPAVRAAAIETAGRAYGGLDILINNAGIGALGKFSDADPDRLRRIMEVNFFSVAAVICAA